MCCRKKKQILTITLKYYTVIHNMEIRRYTERGYTFVGKTLSRVLHTSPSYTYIWFHDITSSWSKTWRGIIRHVGRGHPFPDHNIIIFLQGGRFSVAISKCPPSSVISKRFRPRCDQTCNPIRRLRSHITIDVRSGVCEEKTLAI